jgi:hypothetical protein
MRVDILRHMPRRSFNDQSGVHWEVWEAHAALEERRRDVDRRSEPRPTSDRRETAHARGAQPSDGVRGLPHSDYGRSCVRCVQGTQCSHRASMRRSPRRRISAARARDRADRREVRESSAGSATARGCGRSRQVGVRRPCSARTSRRHACSGRCRSRRDSPTRRE